MYQFFVESEQVAEEFIQITGSDVNHIRNVLRMKPGEKIIISDKSGNSFFCHIEKLEESQVIAAIDEKDEQGTELANQIVLF